MFKKKSVLVSYDEGFNQNYFNVCKHYFQIKAI